MRSTNAADPPTGVVARLRGFVSHLGFEALAFVARVVPLEVALELGAGGGTVTWLLWWNRRRLAEINVRRSLPGLSSWQVRGLVHGTFRHAGRNLFEFLRFPLMGEVELRRRVRVEGGEYMAAARRRGRGVLGLSAHLGLFELLPATANTLDLLSCALVGRPIANPVLDHKVLELRESLGTQTLPSKGSIRQILRHLKRGEGVGMVLDQHLSPRRGGMPVEFFGRPAFTMTAVAFLQRRTGAAVLPFFMVREGRSGRHRFIVTPPLDYERPFEDDERNDLHNTQRYTGVIEDMVRRWPDQWFWFHHRWRRASDYEGARG